MDRFGESIILLIGIQYLSILRSVVSTCTNHMLTPTPYLYCRFPFLVFPSLLLRLSPLLPETTTRNKKSHLVRVHDWDGHVPNSLTREGLLFFTPRPVP